MTRAPRFGVAAVLVALGGGCTTSEPVRHANLGLTPAGDFQLRIASVEERKFATVVRQRFDFSCGSAALATLLHYHYGAATSEEDTFRGMWSGGDHTKIRKLGFSLLDMKRYLEARGARANGFKVTLAQVEAARVPGIALLTTAGYRHFVVVKGIAGGEILIGDPSLGLRMMSADEFTKAWNGILFVLDSDLDRGRQSFNAPNQWANYNRAPLGSRLADPISLQALSLTAPFYRDF